MGSSNSPKRWVWMPYRTTSMQSFVQGHPFIDGIKGIAFALVDIVLRENGYRFNVGNDEIIEFLLSLAKREFELEGVEEWLMKSVKLR